MPPVLHTLTTSGWNRSLLCQILWVLASEPLARQARVQRVLNTRWARPMYSTRNQVNGNQAHLPEFWEIAIPAGRLNLLCCTWLGVMMNYFQCQIPCSLLFFDWYGPVPYARCLVKWTGVSVPFISSEPASIPKARKLFNRWSPPFHAASTPTRRRISIVEWLYKNQHQLGSEFPLWIFFVGTVSLSHKLSQVSLYAILSTELRRMSVKKVTASSSNLVRRSRIALAEIWPTQETVIATNPAIKSSDQRKLAHYRKFSYPFAQAKYDQFSSPEPNIKCWRRTYSTYFLYHAVQAQLACSRRPFWNETAALANHAAYLFSNKRYMQPPGTNSPIHTSTW